MPNLPSTEILKIILVGESSVGKTSIRKQYMGQGFKSTYMATIGADFSFAKHNDKRLSIWDLAGEPNYNLIRKQYYLGAAGAILVFDITRPDTFDKLKYWIREINAQLSEQIPLIFVGNKHDLADHNETIDDEEIVQPEVEKWEKRLGIPIPLFYSSAKTGFNIDALFDEIIDLMEN